ncbi:hypothetical protein DUI87_21073 [Hirundo rustica rustica]|uniref:Interleukin-12 subunit alpha n=1 Tax=Hirundo rustica rustica TaxID=333673 RepID=A0A3M0JLJ8_HIRRU|nr:hypothetical protein DUI87_21073 [Hirundo rustica rustica]
MERSSSTGNGTGSTGSGTGSGTGNGTGSRNTGNSTGNSTGSGSRNIGSGTGKNIGIGSGNGTGNSTGNSSRNIGIGTGSGTGNSTGSGSRNVGNTTGNGSGSGRAAPPGGAGRALLCLALLLPALLLPPARALPNPARTLPNPARTLPSPARTLPSPARTLPSPPHNLSRCLNRSWALLEAANTSLHRLKEHDILRFNCTFEEVDLENITESQINTITACTAEDPGPGNCPVLERSTFDEGKCLQGISEDLRAYRPHLRNLEDPQLLVALDELMEVRIPAPNSSKIQEIGKKKPQFIHQILKYNRAGALDVTRDGLRVDKANFTLSL